MRTHPRLRRTTQWVGLLISLAILVAWLGSIPPIQGRVWVQRACLGRYFVYLDLHSGRIGTAVMRYDAGPKLPGRIPSRWSIARLANSPIHLSSFGVNWPSVHRTVNTERPRLIEILASKMFSRSAAPAARPFLTTYAITLPLWLPFLLFAIPAAYLYHRDRRRPPEGHCQSCGYNLTGNQSNKCPECGTPTPKPVSAAPATAAPPNH